MIVSDKANRYPHPNCGIMINENVKNRPHCNFAIITILVTLFASTTGAINVIVTMQDAFAADAVSDCFSFVANVVVDVDDFEEFVAHKQNFVNSLPNDVYMKHLNNGTAINSLSDLAAVYTNHPGERYNIGNRIEANLTAAGISDSENTSIMHCIYETVGATNVKND